MNEHPPGYVEAQQFELPILNEITNRDELIAALRSLPLPRCCALRDQAEAELLRVYPDLRHELAIIARAGPGTDAAFLKVMDRDPRDPEQPVIRGRRRTLALIFRTLAALAFALEQRAQGGNRR